MTIKPLVIINKDDLILGKPRVYRVDGLVDLGVDREYHCIHLTPQILSQLRSAPPDAKAHLVTVVSDIVKEPGVSRDRNCERGLLLPTDLVEDFHDDDLQAVFEFIALDLISRVLKRCLAGTRVEVVEAKHTCIHYVKEAKIVPTD